MPMYHKRTVKDVMFYSINMKKLNSKLLRIQLVKKMGIKVVSGYDNPIYIQLCLSEIELIKQLFVYAVELGDEAIIPRQLL